MRMGASPLRRSALAAAVALVAVCTMASGAWAQSCTAQIDSISFGDVANATVDTTGSITATCTAPLGILTTMMVCVHIGNGSGGASTGGARTLVSGANTLNYNLYTNSGRTTIWGSAYWSYAPRPQKITVTIPALGGTGSATQTIYARFPSGQNAKPVGFYQSAFNGANITATYQTDLLGLGSCNGTGGTLMSPQPSFTVSARKQVTCSVSSTLVDFGTRGNLNAAVDGTGSLAINCSPNLPYTVGLGNGQNGTGPTDRKMSKGADRVTYGLYKDSGRSNPWGDAGSQTLGGTGTGASQNITVYGRVPAQATPSIGTYNDTVVVTITY